MKLLLAALVTAVSVAALGAGASAGGVVPERAAAAEMEVLTLTVRQTRYGRILFDGKKRVLYGFTRDRRGGPSRCYGECAKAWPVYFAKGTLKAGNGVKRSLRRRTPSRPSM